MHTHTCISYPLCSQSSSGLFKPWSRPRSGSLISTFFKCELEFSSDTAHTFSVISSTLSIWSSPGAAQPDMCETAINCVSLGYYSTNKEGKTILKYSFAQMLHGSPCHLAVELKSQGCCPTITSVFYSFPGYPSILTHVANLVLLLTIYAARVLVPQPHNLPCYHLRLHHQRASLSRLFIFSFICFYFLSFWLPLAVLGS